MTYGEPPAPKGRWTLRLLGPTAAAAALTLTLSACSGGSSPVAATAAAGTASDAPSASAGIGGASRGTPATSGTIAAVAANSIEVQNTSTGQTTVKYSGSTKFAEEQKTTLAAVKAGECVTASSATSSSSRSASSAPSSGSAGRTITAQMVTITSTANGSCTIGGFGRTGSGTPPSGFSRPSGAPSGSFPSGARGNAGFADRVSGKVESVSGSTILVQSIRRASASASASTTTTDTVGVTASTTFLQTAATSSRALAVGKCATAIGAADATGAVNATRIAITPATTQGCQTGVGRFGGGGGGQGSGTGG